VHHAFQPRAFLPQGLCLFRIVPDVRVFQLPAYLFEPFLLLGKVKDTP